MPKIIQILHHVPPKEIDFWHVFFEGWHSRYSKEVAKRIFDYQVEYWTPSLSTKKVEIIRDGVLYRAVPAVKRPDMWTD